MAGLEDLLSAFLNDDNNNDTDNNNFEGNGFDELNKTESVSKSLGYTVLGAAAIAVVAGVTNKARIAHLRKKNAELREGMGWITNRAEIKKNEDEIRKLGGTP